MSCSLLLNSQALELTITSHIQHLKKNALGDNSSKGILGNDIKLFSRHAVLFDAVILELTLSSCGVITPETGERLFTSVDPLVSL